MSRGAIHQDLFTLMRNQPGMACGAGETEMGFSGFTVGVFVGVFHEPNGESVRVPLRVGRPGQKA